MPVSPRPVDVLRRLLALWPDDPAGCEAVCAAIRRWPPVLEEASRHGVLGVLSPLLITVVPAQVRGEIEQRRLAERLWSQSLEQTLGEVLAELEDAAIKTVLLKGPILSERLYGDATVRLSTDLDLLIRPADLDRAVQALHPLGYKAPDGPAEQYYRRHHHHLALDRPKGPRVELHFRAFTGFGIEIRAEEFVERSGRYPSSRGLACSILSPEDELLFLAIHAAGHGLARLGWLYDIKIWLRKYPHVHWPIVFARARRRQVEKALAFTLAVVHCWFGVAIPSSKRPTRYEHQLLVWSENCPEDSRAGKLLAFWLQASLCDRPGLAFNYLSHHFGRIARRRMHQWLPAVIPEDWSG